MTSTLSVLGLYNYDPTIFERLALPEGVDSELLVDNLLFELGCLEVLYPSAPFMSDMIDLWSRKELPTWTRLYNAMQIEYNPIENYDRMEEWTDEREENKETTLTDTNILDGQTQNSGGTTQTNNRTTDGKTNAYNDNVLVPSVQEVESGTVSNIDTSKQEVDSTNTRNGSGSEDTSGSLTHKGRVHGNIGVTTSQQMLTAEMQLAPQLNIINYIITSFKNRFCILVY